METVWFFRVQRMVGISPNFDVLKIKCQKASTSGRLLARYKYSIFQLTDESSFILISLRRPSVPVQPKGSRRRSQIKKFSRKSDIIRHNAKLSDISGLFTRYQPGARPSLQSISQTTRQLSARHPARQSQSPYIKEPPAPSHINLVCQIVRNNCALSANVFSRAHVQVSGNSSS
jgi:hypothetical protein